MSKKKKEKEKEKTIEAEAPKNPRSSLRLNFEAICQAVILALFCRTFVAEAYKIPTASMDPTLFIGDHLVVNKMIFTRSLEALGIIPTRGIQRGDIVVFKSVEEPDKNVVKRVIGLPGESVRIDKKQVYINGEPLPEPYAVFNKPAGSNGYDAFANFRGDNMVEMTVPDDNYFVMGDNRDNSYDSRFWGTLPGKMIRGRANVVYWSYDATTEEYLETNFIERIKDLGSVAIHFFTRTRWDRTFYLPR
jgi:signal peptidase I